MVWAGGGIGIRARLKILCPFGREGSSPSPPTILKMYNIPMKIKLISKILVALVFVLVGATVYSNYREQLAIDRSKIPESMEYAEEFQDWIINMKKQVDVSADEFRLLEVNEVFNSAHFDVSSKDNENAYQVHLNKLEEFEDLDDVRFSPNGFQFLDFRRETREDGKYEPYDVYFHGLRENRIIDTKILSCEPLRSCYFDRAFFIDNDSFVISKYSRPISDEDLENEGYEPCTLDEVCTYTIKLHLFDLINSDQFVYESNPYEVNLAEIVEFF